MKRWGDAHMEFLTVLPDIREMAKTSPSKRSLYAALRKAKKISMSYTYFCRLLMRHSSPFPLEQARQAERLANRERMAGQTEKVEKDPSHPAGKATPANVPAANAPAVKQAVAPAPSGPKKLLVVGRRDDSSVSSVEEVKEEDWL